MEISQINSKVVIQPQNKTETVKEEKLNIQLVEDTDVVNISSEALALSNEGGGHPDRPDKP